MTAADLATQFGPTSVSNEERAARDRYERSLAKARGPLKKRSDSFDFGDKAAEMYICAGYGGERSVQPVVGRAGTEDEARWRFEAWRRPDGSRTEQRVVDGATDGAAEYDDGMEL